MQGIGEFFTGFFYGIWGLFDVQIPLFGFTYQQLFIGTAIAELGISVIALLFGFGSSSTSYRSGSSRNPKISSERRNDTK